MASFCSYFMDIETSDIQKFLINDKVIYDVEAANFSMREMNIEDLIGSIFRPMDPDLAGRLYLVYRAIGGRIMIAPLTKSTQIDGIIENRKTIKEREIDIKLLYDMIEI